MRKQETKGKHHNEDEHPECELGKQFSTSSGMYYEIPPNHNQSIKTSGAKDEIG